VSRKPYDPELGILGRKMEDRFVEVFKMAGIKILSITGKTASKYSPSDVTIEIHDKPMRLQIESRFRVLENFLTIHLPDESLDFDYLIEVSLSGKIFMTSVNNVKSSKKVTVPNKYGGEFEQFYDIPIEAFGIFSSIEDLCETLKII
jgi:hypothetical protein